MSAPTYPRDLRGYGANIGTRVIRELTGGAWPLGWYTSRDSSNTRASSSSRVATSNAKRTDEHLELDDLRRTTKVVARTLRELLVPAAPSAR